MTTHEAADEQFRAFMHENLAHAAAVLSAEVAGEPVFGWYLRSIGSRVEHADHGTCWLRVHSEPFATASGDTWTGTADAEGIADVAKPELLAAHEWDEESYGRRQRAELTTFVAEQPVSGGSGEDMVTAPPDLPGQWWSHLRRNLDSVAETVTTRQRTTQEVITRRLRVFWGDRVPSDVENWVCAHGDLHWGNITAPNLVLLDWEHWGLAPRGYDAATLLCHSLLHPPTAQRVMDQFSQVLDTPDGRVSQLAVAARILLRAEHGEYGALVQPLHDHISKILPRRGR
ncbi:phosphotransferase family protein [Nocardioides speluncae]|uniref:phosphotransferase family protein n=1 Tax=Nocardioides speluncae TaxID=2670337 RepID=UPI000D6911B9|nr:phosphotransferase [Nocardioides speluncae]